MIKIWRIKKGKIVTSISLDNKPDLIAHCEKQKNFSAYVQSLIEQDMASLERAERKQKDEIHVELTREERNVYSYCRRYFREFGGMKFEEHYPYFDLQPEPDLLRILLGDVRDRIPKGDKLRKYIEQLKTDDTLWETFYDKIGRYWRQENPIPEEWKKETVAGLTIYEALSRIIPEALRLKNKKVAITIKRISELVGLTYQQTYTNLLPYIKPILRKMEIQI